MSEEKKSPIVAEPKPVRLVAGLTLLAFLIFGAAVIYILKNKTEPLTPDQARIVEREKILQDVRAEANTSLHQAGWIDKDKGIVRIPIGRAMEIAVTELKAKPVKSADIANPAPSLIVPAPVPKQ